MCTETKWSPSHNEILDKALNRKLVPTKSSLMLPFARLAKAENFTVEDFCRCQKFRGDDFLYPGDVRKHAKVRNFKRKQGYIMWFKWPERSSRSKFR